MARASGESRTTRPAARVRRIAKGVAERLAGRRRRASGDTPYHHGDLHEALLQAAERVLERDGLAGLTLRAVAREAGVSHAAPTHHFGDLTGLVSELAAIGYRLFHAALVAASDAETHPLMKAMARAKAYVAYAQARPGMFGLMFRTERLDMTRPSLHEAATASFEVLVSAAGVGHGQKPDRDPKISGQSCPTRTGRPMRSSPGNSRFAGIADPHGRGPTARAGGRRSSATSHPAICRGWYLRAADAGCPSDVHRAAAW